MRTLSHQRFGSDKRQSVCVILLSQHGGRDCRLQDRQEKIDKTLRKKLRRQRTVKKLLRNVKNPDYKSTEQNTMGSCVCCWFHIYIAVVE